MLSSSPERRPAAAPPRGSSTRPATATRASCADHSTARWANRAENRYESENAQNTAARTTSQPASAPASPGATARSTTTPMSTGTAASPA